MKNQIINTASVFLILRLFFCIAKFGIMLYNYVIENIFRGGQNGSF